MSAFTQSSRSDQRKFKKTTGCFRPSTVIKPKFEQPVSGSGSRVSSKEIETVVLDPKVLIDRNERQTFRPRFDWRHEYIAVAMSTTISVLGVIE
jgi:hypothetical protein